MKTKNLYSEEGQRKYQVCLHQILYSSPRKLDYYRIQRKLNVKLSSKRVTIYGSNIPTQTTMTSGINKKVISFFSQNKKFF